MIAVSTAWNAERHVGWAPAVRELLDAGVRRVALDGPALQADAEGAGKVVRAAKGAVACLFAPAPARDATSPAAGGGLAGLRADRRAAAVAAAHAAGRAALAAGTSLVVLRPGTIPALDAAREDRWDARLAQEGASEGLRDEVRAACDELLRDRPRFLDALCRSVWELARALPEVTWSVATPAVVAGLPFPDEIVPFLSELRGRRVGYWHDAACAARLGALGAADAHAWIDHAGGATSGVTVSDWSPPALGVGAHGADGAAAGRSPPGVGLVEWTTLRGQLTGRMERVLRLPPHFPAPLLGDALREAERLTA